MRLISCHIDGFGRLSNFDLSFDPELSVICQENGWGKSTLAAFLRVMFYGLQNDSKRSQLESDRKHYKPWQGGVFGGRLIFELDGREYRVTRQFGDKEADDFFEIRDQKTNIVVDDFSSNLGEEIFGINNESFVRSVFISQSDVVTSATDSINAKIGNIEDNTGDIDSFEKAFKILKDYLNQNSPSKKTGSISQKKEKKAILYNELLTGKSLEDSISQYEKRVEDNEKSLTQVKIELTKCRELDDQARRDTINKTTISKYNSLVEEEKKIQDEVNRLQKEFPGKILDNDAYLSLKASVSEYERAKITIERYREEYGEVEAYCDKVSMATEAYNAYQAALLDYENKETALNEAIELKNKKKFPAFILAGVILLLVALSVGVFYDKTIGLVVGAAAILLFAIQHCVNKMSRNAQEPLMEALTGELDAAAIWLNSCEERLQKELSLDEKAKNVREAFSEYGYGAREDYASLLEEIHLNINSLERALAEYRIRGQQRASYYETNNIEALLSREGNVDIDTDELTRRFEELSDEEGRIISMIQQDKQILEGLYEKSDILAEKQAEYEGLEEEIATDIRKYELVGLSQKFLAQAKEELTNEYTKPLLDSFKKYYQIVANNTIDFYMDANTNLTFEECGIQRDIALQSQGIKDLIGLCLRTAFVDAMYSEQRPVLFLDDPFVNLDDEKVNGARQLLLEIGKKYQIVYFTCTKTRT